MGKAITDFGLQTAGNVINAGMGLLLGDHYDRRQLRQQTDLQNLQIKGQKEMADYSYKKQLEMWNATNYEAQKAHLKAAGLNPGLMYGMSGGGGTTTGSGASTSVGSGNAPTGGREIQDMIGMGIQSQLLQAQKANIEANTEKTKVETAKTAGVDTKKAETEILDLTQGIENKKAQEAMTKVQTRIAGIEENLKDRTLEDSVRAIGWNAEKIMQEMEQARYETNIKEDTWRDKVKMVQAELMGAWLKNALTKIQTTKTGTEIEDIIRQGIQRWKALELSGRGVTTQENKQQHEAWLNDVQKSSQIPMDILREAMDGILRGSPQKHVQINTERNYY